MRPAKTLHDSTLACKTGIGHTIPGLYLALERLGLRMMCFRVIPTSSLRMHSGELPFVVYSKRNP